MKILIIEDDKFFQQFYFSKLSEAGYEVAIAVDGEDGLMKIQSFKPNLILLDIIMPKKDGFEVLEAMSQNNLTNSIPVLVFSTLGQEQDIEKAKKLGAKDYVNKSFFDLDTLKSKVAELLKA